MSSLKVSLVKVMAALAITSIVGVLGSSAKAATATADVDYSYVYQQNNPGPYNYVTYSFDTNWSSSDTCSHWTVGWHGGSASEPLGEDYNYGPALDSGNYHAYPRSSGSYRGEVTVYNFETSDVYANDVDYVYI